MSIRLRTVDGVRVALCAVESEPLPGDVYLDDADHYALAAKFAQDYRTGIEYPREWAAMASQKVRDAREECERWSASRGQVSGRHLTPAEKARHLEEWERETTDDEGVRPLMALLNQIDDVCTVQSCVGHARGRADGSVYVESAHVEMRLGERATRAFYAAMPRTRSLPFVEDALLSMRPGYEVASVWGQPGSLAGIVGQLVLVLAPTREHADASGEAACL